MQITKSVYYTESTLIETRIIMNHELLNLFAIIVVFGVVMWLVNAYIPMAAGIKSLLNTLVVIVLVLYVLEFFKVIPVILPMLNVIR